jgi:hypothetical protein
MKIHRLVILEHAITGKVISSTTDVVSHNEALYGYDDQLDMMALLKSGTPYNFSQVIAGVRIHGRLVPAHARNRQAIQSAKSAIHAGVLR